jgi:hypothetical protein
LGGGVRGAWGGRQIVDVSNNLALKEDFGTRRRGLAAGAGLAAGLDSSSAALHVVLVGSLSWLAILVQVGLTFLLRVRQVRGAPQHRTAPHSQPAVLSYLARACLERDVIQIDSVEPPKAYGLSSAWGRGWC